MSKQQNQLLATTIASHRGKFHLQNISRIPSPMAAEFPAYPGSGIRHEFKTAVYGRFVVAGGLNFDKSLKQLHQTFFPAFRAPEKICRVVTYCIFLHYRTLHLQLQTNVSVSIHPGTVAFLPHRNFCLKDVVYAFVTLGTERLTESSHQEHTIAEPVSFSGIGLHSGVPVSMRLLPAPAGCGVIFRRTDLDNFEIPAIGRNVAKVSYATSLMRKGVLIQTTEHLLSALIGMGVDNVIVEIDNLELPILDGSALPYVDAFRSVGLKAQRRHREYLRILKSMEVREGDKFIGVYPGEGYSVSYKIDFPTPIGQQGFVVDLATRDYAAQIAPARTFGFKEDEAMLRNMGLIRGVSEQSAIILNRQRVLNGPLRYDDEFVRHKVLDLIGDLALAGHHILGHVVAERAGHAMHTALVSRLLKDRSAWALTTIAAEKKSRTKAPARAAALATA